MSEDSVRQIADYLTDGYWEAQGAFRHSFDVAPGGTLTVNITALTAEGQQLAKWGLEAWTNVSGIQFEFVTNPNANITFDDNEDDAFARVTSLDSTQGRLISTHVNVATSWLESYGTTMDSYSFQTYIHEIGHALGLGHSGPYNGHLDSFPLFLDDSWHITVMSYVPQTDNERLSASFATVVTPMVADIAAIHELYGEPDSVNGGNTTYGYRSNVGGYMGEYFDMWATGQDNPFFYVNTDEVSHVTFADIDNDGDIDMYTVGADFFTVSAYENRRLASGEQKYYLISQFAWFEPITDLEVADFDNDGDMDYFIHTLYGYNIFQDTGTELSDYYSYIYKPGDTVYVDSELADYDNDGDLDIISTDRMGYVYIHWNNGTPTRPDFTDNPTHWELSKRIWNFEFVDIDADNDLDIFITDHYADIYLMELENNTYTYNYLPNPLAGIWYGDVPDSVVSEFTFVDMDNDNDMDAVVVGNEGHLYYFENTGTNRSPEYTPTTFGKGTTFTIYDTDGYDTLHLYRDIHNQYISLEPGSASSVFGLTDNLVIAHDTVIEKVVAGKGDDIIIGNDANNTITGNLGDDRLFGGPGKDTFVFYDDKSHDRILDFTVGEDKIDLRRVEHIDDYGDLFYLEQDGSLIFLLSDTGNDTKIELPGFTIDDFSPNDFLFA